jgi:hypothetical protein
MTPEPTITCTSTSTFAAVPYHCRGILGVDTDNRTVSLLIINTRIVGPPSPDQKHRYFLNCGLCNASIHTKSKLYVHAGPADSNEKNS